MNEIKLKGTAANSDLVPNIKLANGNEIPAIGLGTFGSDSLDAETVAQTVLDAVSHGYRHIDCASVYGNEKEIGKTFKIVFGSRMVKREEMWITSKVWNDKHDKVIESCKQSLSDLGLEYLDLYLVHWPFPNFHPPQCGENFRGSNAVPYIHEKYLETWRQMEQLVKMGLVRNIGTSNMTVPKLKLLLADAVIKPSCNQMELHPHFQQPELFDFCKANEILPVAYSPLGSPGRPERDRTSEDTVDLEDPIILEIAGRMKIHPAVVCLKWAVQRGQVPIPFSVNHYKTNIEAVIGEKLSEQDMKAIENIDRNCRLIKGQVFLWKDNQSWQDLWDVNGTITPE